MFVIVARRALCEICRRMWDLDPFENPESCVYCGSKDWCWGIEPRDSKFIRQGISRLRRRVNPGASSKKRQEQGREGIKKATGKSKTLPRPGRARG